MGISSFSSSTFKSLTRNRGGFSVTLPTWNTAAGSLATVYTTKSYNLSVSATSTMYYAIDSGSLPTGMSLNQSTGQITGTPSGIADYSQNQVYNFSIRAYGVFGSSARSFSITANSIYVGVTCATANEGGVASASVPSGYVIKRVDFISYGTPNGSCGAYTYGSCHAGYNGSAWVGNTSFSLSADNGVFGDPCGGVGKRLYIQVSHGPA